LSSVAACGVRSFPTRRSADLATVRGAGVADRVPDEVGRCGDLDLAVDAGHGRSRQGTTAIIACRAAPVFAPLSPRIRRGTPRARSEEHTSELQSRENLVCRLL